MLSGQIFPESFCVRMVEGTSKRRKSRKYCETESEHYVAGEQEAAYKGERESEMSVKIPQRNRKCYSKEDGHCKEFGHYSTSLIFVLVLSLV